MSLWNIDGQSFPGQVGTKNICHQSTKTQRALLCRLFLVSLYKKKKSFVKKGTKFTTKKPNDYKVGYE